jgi:2-polyprenyl-6-methoxyphenol hydroxylase-like FAD-dependent oxidoreductase
MTPLAGYLTVLDAAGVRVEVHERNPGPSAVSKGRTMHPRTLEVLITLEAADGRRLSDALVDEGRKVPHTHFAALPSLLDYTGLDTPFPFVLLTPQWRTERVLADHLWTREVPVHYGAEVTSVAQSKGAVQVAVNDVTHEAAYVIGADGAHSTVRHAAGIDFPGDPPTLVAIADLTQAITTWTHPGSVG